SHSVYVGQVDYMTTPEELLGHFEACGTVERVTIVCDKYTGKPKGFAYLEFQTEASVENALKLEGSEFKGRNLKVTAKRVNVAGFNQQQSYEGGRGGGGFR
ncbi:Pabpn1 Rrm, partial [Fragilariopsis cylindrus CCMP1102]